MLIGGDFQGRNPEVQNAFRTYVGSNTIITADAVVSGDGGKVIVWSDDATRFYGTISARGGSQSGNGGFVEVSSKNWLDFHGSVNLGAVDGQPGTLLLDPLNIIVAIGGLATIADVATFAANPGTTQTISPATLNAAGATVVLQATDDVTISDPVNLATAAAGFVAQAGKDINVNASITTNGGRIHLEADSPHQPAGVNDIGLLTINAPVTSNGGAITLIAGGKKLPTEGGFVLNADVNAGAGGINVSLSNAGTFTFFIGAGGNTQLSSNDTGALKTTGALVLGQALTAGPAGQSTSVATGSVLLTVDKITNETADPIQLSADSGSSFQLISGGGGIFLDRPLTTFQDTVLSTTGDVTINKTLGTSNNDLTITAATFILGPNGSINTGTGTFTCTGTGCPTGATGQVIWDGGALTLNWFDALNWNTDGVPDNTKDVTIGSGFGTIVVNGAGEAKSLIANSPLQVSTGQSLALTNASTFSDTFTLSGGSLAGTGDVSVGGASASLTWSGGSMASGGTFFLGSGRNGTLSNPLTLNRLFENHGTLTLLSGVTLGGTGSITNVGTMSVSGSTLSVPVLNSSPVQFTGGTNVITSAGGITGGTVEFLSGTTTFNATSTYNVGTTNINGGTANFDTTASTTTLNLSSGTLGGGGNFTVSGPFNWSAGTLTGGGLFTTNGTSTLTANVAHNLTVRTWNNAATLNIEGGSLDLASAAVLNNQAGATINFVNTANLSPNPIFGSGTVNNAGTLNQNGTGTRSISSGVTFNNQAGGVVNVNAGTLEIDGGGTDSGLYDVDVSTVLQFGGGTRTLGAGSNITGAGNVTVSGGTVTVNGAYGIAATGSTSITGGTLNLSTGGALSFASTLSLSSGALGGSSNLALNGFNWSGGIVSGSGSFTTNGTSTLSGNVAHTLDSRTWTNAGTVNVNDGSLDLNGATAVFNNQAGATFNMAAGNTSPNPVFGNNALAQFNNAGTFNQDAASAKAIGGTLTFNNQAGGAVNVNAADLNIAVGGNDAGAYDVDAGRTLQFSATRTLGAGASLTGSGTVSVTGGTLSVDANVTTPSTLTLALNSGTLGGTGNVVMNGPFNWSGGTVTGAGTFTTSGTSTLTGNVAHTLNSRTWNNAGTVNVNDGSLDLNGATAVFNNQAGATFNMAAGNSSPNPIFGYNILAQFNNAGTLNQNAPANKAVGSNLTFTNQSGGTMNVNAGTLTVSPFNSGTNSGTINIASGATLSTSNNSLINASTGIIRGSGTLNLGSGTLTNNGTIRPGGSPGTLTVTGNLTLNTGSVVDIELASGLVSDVLAVSGNASLAGTLNVIPFGGYQGNSGDLFTVITCGAACGGGFNTINQPVDFNVTPTLNATNFTLGVNSLINRWIGTTGDWNNALLWNRGHIPLSTEDVVIPDVGMAGVSETITSAFGVHSIRSLTSAENLVLSGGSLDLSVNSSIGAGAMLSVGAGAALNLGNSVALNGPGSLSNQGTLTLNNGAVGAALGNQGTINIGGASAINSAMFDMNAGTLNIPGGATLTKNGGSFNWNGGSLSGAGNLTMAGGAMFNIAGSGARTLNGLTLGAINLNLGGGSLTLQSGTLNASGTTTIATGAAMVAQGGTLNAAGGTIDVSGIFQAGGGTVMAGAINVQPGGTLTGAGAVTGNINNAGTVAPGASPGTLTINGNYTQGPGGMLAIEIGGTAASTQYDQLLVNGNATLDGTLNATLVNGFVPSGSEAFTVIRTGGTVTGTFATTNLPTTPSFSMDYLVASVSLTTGGAPIAPPPVVEQTVVAAMDQGATSQAATPADPREEEEKRETQKKPVCTGGSSGGGAAATARPVVSGGGGGGGRCTSRGCF
ncbi:MAG: hypothetical protein HYU76_14055 [Betaproteobacteria bacterium]|nr:hypothetical protein [Betaproteobacteria bacterium]